MKDRDRLNLLKEIAGTSIYEERRAESEKIMAETVSKQVRIDEVVTFIDERLGEIEKEKEELTEFDLLDKKRRALQYTIHDKELTKVTSPFRR
jgi:structural maintenance of chromosome 3 (chondroitin sulfate proteoglycan 6)